MNEGQGNYGEMDQPGQGMFNGNRDGEDQDEDIDEYFDDAGDIGYLPADHVSYFFQIIFNL